MSVDGVKFKTRLASPAALLAVGVMLGVGLMLTPGGFSGAMKGGVAAVLRPGQLGVLSLRQRGDQIAAGVKTHFHTAGQLAEVRRQRDRLEQDNRRLAVELAAAQSRLPDPADDPAGEAAEPLLLTRCVEARVLGQQARAYLGRHHLLDVGSAAGVEPDAMVLEAPPGLIDQGGNAGLEGGQLVLSQGRVWGKIVTVGPTTSTVRTVVEPGYRDLVRLADPNAENTHRPAGPQGILEGTGEPLARIRLIEVTEPVAEGDLVYTAAGRGLLPQPLLYGRVVRVRRPVGAAHWDIWMKPAVAPGRPEHVTVLRTELNPVRVAGG